MRSTVTVRVPASTSNLGPGFDALGIALSLHNRIELTRREDRSLHIVSSIPEDARAGAMRMLEEARNAFAQRTEKKVSGLDVSLTGGIPVARGLGSSVTLRLGLVAGLNEFAGAPLDRDALLEIVADLEHHPDNAAPAVFGGFAVAAPVGKSIRCLHFPVDAACKFVTLIPHFEVSTEQARKLVPDLFSKQDAVQNLSRAALITAAFASGNFIALRGMFEDRFHQPYRQKLIPELFRVIAAGERAGAVGGWLSGSGSTIICLAIEAPEKVAAVMHRELPNSEVKILSPDNQGYELETANG